METTAFKNQHRSESTTESFWYGGSVHGCKVHKQEILGIFKRYYYRHYPSRWV